MQVNKDEKDGEVEKKKEEEEKKEVVGTKW